jgi:ribosome-binding factor A
MLYLFVQTVICAMETKRQLQLGELVKRHISMVLLAEGSNIYGNAVMVTVTSVKMTPDFSLAKIYLSIFNTENKQEVMLLLEQDRPRVQQALYYRLKKHMRRMPEIAFHLDDTMDEMYRIDEMFDSLYKANQMGTDDEA